MALLCKDDRSSTSGHAFILGILYFKYMYNVAEVYVYLYSGSYNAYITSPMPQPYIYILHDT